MNNKYIVVFYNKNFYREVELKKDMKKVKVGTNEESDIILGKEYFELDFQIIFENNNGIWNVLTNENTYFTVVTTSNSNKFTNKELIHGEEISLYSDFFADAILNIKFSIDFSSDKKKYDMQIDIRNITNARIGGGKQNNVCIMDDDLADDYITVTKSDEKYFVIDNNTRFGLFVNGNRVDKYTQIENTDFFSIASYSFYFNNGILYTESAKNVFLNGLLKADFGVLKSNLEYPMFNRNTRIKSVIPTEKISILDPPTKMENSKTNLLTSLLPSVCTLAISIAMRSMMGNNGGAFILLSSGTMAIGIITSIFSFFHKKKEYASKSVEREQKYNDYISKKKEEILNYRKVERDILNEQYRDMKHNINCVLDFSGELFDREKNDIDFLVVRIGTGVVEAKRVIDYKQQEKFESEDELANIPAQIAEEYKNIERGPITIDLKKCNAIGVISDKLSGYEIMKNMTLDICIRQYYNDVRVFYITDENHAKGLYWLRFMPHVNNPELNRRNIVCDEESKNVIFEYLFNEFSRRERAENGIFTRFVIFVFDEMGIKSHPVSKYIENAAKLGAVFIFFEEKKEHLPLYCNQLMYAYSNNKATITSSYNKNECINFSYARVPDEMAMQVAFKLAPVYCEEVSLESTLRKNISLYELLGIFKADELNLMQRWSNSQVDRSMAVPLGVRTKDEVVYLDLHEKAHGPHGLVAGTTGSGKSEILQSYILSAATLFHPYEVSFVIIDFKGGGMVNQFKNLPHLVGAITNIDGKEINRSLLSIKAELVKRQNYFAQAEVNHIDKYISKYKRKEVSYPLPHLIIIVDEFAELKAEQPEFMKELISAARIGRSLGVHLILATQKPSGQVNEQIWSNSKFKLCLKVQTKEDSNEVIKSTLAAEIVEPGRAYLQVGNNEIFELFQSAYSGCSANMIDNGGNSKSYNISTVDFVGRRNVIYKKKNYSNSEEIKTQLMELVEYIHDYCENANIKKLPDICLPPLQDVINFPNVSELRPCNIEMTTELGVFDDPEYQNQDVAVYDLANENTIIIGSARYGKTNMLQSIIKSLATKYSPDEVNIYILDFASMVLKNFEGLSHVGGVVTASEDEKLVNLFKLLEKEIVERKERLISVGVSSFVSYKEAGYTDLPQIVVIIDNITVLRELYFQDDSQLLSLCRESLSVGISMIIANASTKGFGYKYFSNFSRRIALFCNDSNEYSSIFDYCRNKPDDKPGRFIMEIDKRFIDCQAYVAFQGEKEFERAIEMRKFIEETNARYDNNRAKMIPVIPKVLNNKFVEDNYRHFIKTPHHFIMGLDYSNVMPYAVDLKAMKPIAISGNEESGRSNFIKYLVYTFAQRKDMQSEVYIFDGVNKKLRDLENYSNVKHYSIGTTKVSENLTIIQDTLEARYNMLAEGRDEEVDKASLIIIIINDSAIVESICSDRNLLAIYNKINGMYKDMKVFTVLGNIPNMPIAYSAPEIMKNIRDNKNILFFGDIKTVKLIDVPIAQQRKFNKAVNTGEAFFIMDSDCKKLKTPICVMGRNK